MLRADSGESGHLHSCQILVIMRFDMLQHQVKPMGWCLDTFRLYNVQFCEKLREKQLHSKWLILCRLFPGFQQL
ncbi:hypothetical protein D3C86_1944350 [compost metagenome]